ncbi:unnamed protein product [Orchesella dallaii]|uniref:Uncharacterized protein n=1 Tax=Orchesella dallaii TaxID=48710 RepID=A0ABP1PI66_9HEXA
MEAVDLDDVVSVLKNEKDLVTNWENFLASLHVKQIGKKEITDFKLEFEDSLDESSLLCKILSKWIEENGDKSTVKVLGTVLKKIDYSNVKYKLETTFQPSAIIKVGTYKTHKKLPSVETLFRSVNWSKNGGKDDCLLNLPILLRLLTEIGNKPVVVISINGNSCPKKSALADQFLRLIKYVTGDPHRNSKDFENGFLPTAVEFENATGIQVWNEPFYVKNKGTDIGVILMEVHHGVERNGVIELDPKTTALGLLISSHSIFLENENKSDIIQWFKDFLEVNDPKIYPKRLYQALTVLFDKETSSAQTQQHFEAEGNLLMSKLFNKCTKELPAPFEKYFEKVKSDIVSLKNPNSTHFCLSRNMPRFIEHLLKPESISSSVKQIFGKEITGNILKEFVCLWAQLVTTFNNGKIYPKTIKFQTEEMLATNLVKEVLKNYRDRMKNFFWENPAAVHKIFEKFHAETVGELRGELMNMSVSKSIKENLNVQLSQKFTALKYKFSKEISSKSESDTRKLPEIIEYDEKNILGRGSSETVVYKGTFGKREVAVKRLNGVHFDIENANKELLLLINCDGHKNVVQCFHGERRNDFFLMALELCNCNLEEWLKRIKFLDSEINAIDILRQTTEGLAHLHSHKILHRDIKPQNILLLHDSYSKQVCVKISDFGISKKFPEHRYSATITSGSGTEGWMAPEIIQYNAFAHGNGDLAKIKMTQTFASDIFSLGCVFYYVLTEGIHPFGDPVRRQVAILDDKPSTRETEIEEYYRGGLPLIKRMIAKDQAIRPKISYILKHPLLWDSKRIIDFLVVVSNGAKENEENERVKTAIECLENGAKELMGIVEGNTNGWLSRISPNSNIFRYLTVTGQNKNKGKRVMELIRAIRNMQNHYGKLPHEAQEEVGTLFDDFARYWIEKFPHLVPRTWEAFEGVADITKLGLREYFVVN